jgi:hypothetical protein
LKPFTTIAACASLLAAGLLVNLVPTGAALIVAVVWGMVLAFSLPRNLSIVAPMFLLLSVPADHIATLNGPVQGFMVLGLLMILAASQLLRNRGRLSLRLDLDLLLLVTVLTIPTLLNLAGGESRGLLFWFAAVFALIWLRSAQGVVEDLPEQVMTAIVLAGSLGSVLAILAYVGTVDLAGIVPGYEPSALDFDSFMGLRASGLSGHPLRFGTLTMLGSIISLAWLAESQRTERSTVLASTSLGLSSLGLALSGARGAWLGLCLGVAAMILGQRDALARRRVVRLMVAISIGAGIIALSGFGTFLYERLAGSAAHPASWAQRQDALVAVAGWGRRIPLFGLGFGGATELTARMGMLLPNLENEYLRFLLAAGVAGPLVLLVMGVRRIRSAIRLPSGLTRSAGIGCLTALFVNMATYNLFSWSVAPSLFVAVAVLTLGKAREPLHADIVLAHRMAVRPA